MNATHTNRLAGLLNDCNILRKPACRDTDALRCEEPVRPEAPAHWLRRFLDNLMRTLAAPAV